MGAAATARVWRRNLSSVFPPLWPPLWFVLSADAMGDAVKGARAEGLTVRSHGVEGGRHDLTIEMASSHLWFLFSEGDGKFLPGLFPGVPTRFRFLFMWITSQRLRFAELS